MAGASDFKLGMQLGFAKARHKIIHGRQSGRVLGLGELTKILWFPSCAMAEDSDSKFGVHMGFSKVYHKTISRGKRRRGLGLGNLTNIWGSPLIFLRRLHSLSVNGASCIMLVSGWSTW